jgi:hypothetical protein
LHQPSPIPYTGEPNPTAAPTVGHRGNSVTTSARLFWATRHRLAEQRYSHEALTSHCDPVPAALACGIASAMFWPDTAVADGGPDLAAIDRYVRSEMDRQRIPGVALGIVQRDRIVHVQGIGQARKSGPEVTPQTRF